MLPAAAGYYFLIYHGYMNTLDLPSQCCFCISPEAAPNMGNLLVILLTDVRTQIQGIMTPPRSSWKHSGGPRQMGRWCSWQWTLGQVNCAKDLQDQIHQLISSSWNIITIYITIYIYVYIYIYICMYLYIYIFWYKRPYPWNSILQMTIHVLVVLWREFTWLASVILLIQQCSPHSPQTVDWLVVWNISYFPIYWE